MPGGGTLSTADLEGASLQVHLLLPQDPPWHPHAVKTCVQQTCAGNAVRMH